MDQQSFVSLLIKSRLLTDEQVSQLDSLRELYPESDVLAAILVKHGWITKWQAQMFLSGHSAFYVGRYRLLRLIGQGGMGAVFEATKVNFSKPVAIKMMNSNLTKKADAVARFQREIEAASALGQHPNIVCALDADAVNNVHYLVMEFVKGGDLQTVIDESGPVSEQWGCEFIRQAAMGLQHAHEHQMVHRDIKPANLLLSNDSDGLPVVKILDMGLARFTSEGEITHLTSTGQIMGSIDYISPEQSKDTHSVDIRSDIFSLGCSLFFLLTGKPPYSGDGHVARLMSRVYKAAPLIRSVRPDISEPVERIIARMLDRQPSNRFQTPSELVNELAQIAGTIGQTKFDRPKSQAQIASPTVDPNATDFGKANTTQNQVASNIDAVEPVERLEVKGLSKQDSDQNADFQMFLESMDTQAAAADQVEPTAPPLVAGTRKPNTKSDQAVRGGKRIDRRVLWTTATLIAAAVVAFIWWQTNQASKLTTLEIVLAEELRSRAVANVDGKTVRLATKGRLLFKSPKTKRSLHLSIAGYEPINKEIAIDAGAKKAFDANASLVATTGSSGAWSDISRRVEAFKKKAKSWPPDANDKTAQEIHSLAALHMKIETDQERRDETQKWLDEFPGPFDLLPLKSLGATDPPLATDLRNRLVQILGSSDNRLRHWRFVSSLQFSRDGKFLYSAGAGVIKKWNLADGSLVDSVQIGHSEPQISLNTKGDQLAINAEVVTILDAENLSEELLTIDIQNGSYSVQFSDDDSTIAIGSSDGRVCVYDASTGARRWEKRAHGGQRIDVLAFTSDGKRLATGGSDGTVSVWDVASGEQQHATEKHDRNITSLDFSHAGKYLLVNPRDRKPVRYAVNGESMTVDATYQADRFVTRSLVASDQSLLVQQTGGSVSIRDYNTDELKHTFPCFGNHHTAIALSNDKKQVAFSNYDFTISVFDLAADKPIIPAPKYTGNPPSMHIAPDDSKITVAWERHNVATWNVPSTTETVNDFGYGHVIRQLRYSTRGRDLAIIGSGNEVIVADMNDGTSSSIPSDRLLSSVSFSRKNELLLVGESQQLVVFPLQKPDNQLFSSKSEGQCHTAILSPNGKVVLSTDNGADRRGAFVRLRDIKTNAVRSYEFTDGIPTAIAFHPSGNEFVVGNRAIRIFNTTMLTSSQIDPTDRGAVMQLAYNGTGSLIAAANEDGSVGIYDSKDLRPLHRFQIGPKYGIVKGIQFSSDSRHVVTLNGNGTVYVFRLSEFGEQ